MNRSGEREDPRPLGRAEDIVALLHNVSEVATRYLPEPVRSIGAPLGRSAGAR
jgi:hypothetical protein